MVIKEIGSMRRRSRRRCCFEYGYIIENGLQASEREIHLEDFFWTGSGDGPPNYAQQPSNGAGGGSNDVNSRFPSTIVKTATVLATVYVDGSMENLDPLCTFDCNNYEFNNVETTIPSDRRYWLLTVVGGFFGPQDFPILEEKLAKLYRIAFTRQQAKHLGINGSNSTNSSNSANGGTMERIKRDIQPTKVLSVRDRSVSQVYDVYQGRRGQHHKTKRKKRQSMETVRTNNSLGYDKGLTATLRNKSEYQQILIDRRNSNKRKVTVLIQNVTQLTEEELLKHQDLGTRNDSLDLKNQTEIIYSVFVSGKPVLATTAAKDMELLTDSEVMQVIEHPIMTKAEPYLKDPQATPLIPSHNGNSNLVALIAENPWWIAVLCITCFILLFLLVALLLMTRAKRRRSAELKRLVTSQHGTISPIHHHHHHLDSDTKTEDIHAHDNSAFSKSDEKSDGNLFKGHPVINFPLPPPISRPSSSSSSTSDSSIYYPKRRNKSTLQEILDEKAAHLFHKKCKNHDSEEKSKKDRKKRKYLADNKVGSLEQVEVQCHSPPSTASSDFTLNENPEKNNENIDKNAIISNYHKNKVLHDPKFTQDVSDDDFGIHRYRREPEDSDCGSYLSMISIRSFPKSCVPEPLCRVLEPSVSVTYLDQSDHGSDVHVRSSKHLEPILSEKDEDNLRDGNTQDATSEAGDIQRELNAGAVIYKLEKKDSSHQCQDTTISPIHDPVRTRNRFEGLLEGAIELYASQRDTTDSPSTSEVMASSAAIYADQCRANRGKSAIPFRNPAILCKLGSGTVRPFTAGTSNTSQSKDSTQPPTPSKAWASGAHSPQVDKIRPLSAGPFHKPHTPIVDVSRVLAPKTILDRSELSTAPLIEAIQNELKKFNKDNNTSSCHHY
ncbi:uncharacterized protein LOC134835178 [Culicoides brevitarsis]|uniref:uncharacterized protein LOC134835178 n=1 Tax=Culicoides brevitarsis TaxID=469753 RepID=UPI00307B1DC9